jgi:penicillin amidase
MHTETIDVAGLADTASIIIDRWGIPHIRAGNLKDMFFVQGFNAARDRLWQIDLWRKKGLGLLAADFGPGYLQQDRASRLFLYRGDMQKEWASYGNGAKAVCEHFVDGINAYIDLCVREPERIPSEFGTMGTRPAKWRPEDVVRVRSAGSTRNALSELTRSNVLAKGSVETDLLRQHIEPTHDPLAGLSGLPEALPVDCLDLLKLATAPVTFSAERLASRKEEAQYWRKLTIHNEVVRQENNEGSNGWALHGSRTDTGRPILAGDPHRAHTIPSLRYIVHLCSPEFDGIGAGEPALPGISMGHNGTAAFGLTSFFGHDQEDVYVYETHPDDPHLYRYGDGWELMRLIHEAASLPNGDETTLLLKFTRHGPVLAEYPNEHKAVAVRTIWSEPGTAPYFRSIVTMYARSFEEFRRGMWGWGMPAVNQVYADTSGTIGWAVAGFSPVRPNWDGLLPVPGDGRYEWNAYLDPARLPYAVNPPAGYVATANEMNIPDEWHRDNDPIGYEWIEPSRAERIAEVFATEKIHTLESSKALQTDLLSIPARRLCELLKAIEEPGDNLQRVLDILANWDHRLEASSAAAALFEVWFTKQLRLAIIETLVVDPTIRALINPGDIATILSMLERTEGQLSAPKRDALLARTLADAFVTCQNLMGADPAKWAWGHLHIALFEHALGAVRPEARPKLNVGPLPVGGSESTPMNMMYRPDDFRLTLGASFRMVLDVGDWDKSLCCNAPGQSGDARSPHYADLASIWSSGSYVPMLYSREAIDAAATVVLWLRPG